MKSTAPKLSTRPRRRVCVLFPGALGDFICLLPSIEVLARDGEVDIYAQSEFADLVPQRVAVNSLERPEIWSLFASDLQRDEQAAQFFERYAAIYSWFGSQNRDFVRRLYAASPGPVEIFPFRPAEARLHQIDYYLSCLRQELVPVRRPTIEPRQDAARWCDDFWIRHGLDGQPVLVLGAGSGAREKNWPQNFFGAVADWWRNRVTGSVVLLLGPVEQERGGVEQLRRSCVAASGLRLAQVAALIARSDVFLGNDSGLAHLAAAMGARSIVLFGPTAIEQWAPRGERVTLMRQHTECSPCELETMKNCSHRACLTTLHPERVIDLMRQLPEVLTLTRNRAGITV